MKMKCKGKIWNEKKITLRKQFIYILSNSIASNVELGELNINVLKTLWENNHQLEN